MSNAETKTPTYYNSTYRHGVDEKRRLQIPAKWRPADPELQFTLILWTTPTQPHPCVMVLPPDVMADLLRKMKEMPFTDPKAESLRRLLGRKSDQVTMDKSGRICLPDSMAKGAGIDKEVVLIGMWDRFQIWNPERFESMSQFDDSLSNEAIKLI
ncbi:MAG: hypothetical protein SFY81_04175 [Verrucomicrobiota bacterium]|nr:hypothetical protein [Verrucomicrobiota bacterium]